MVSGEYLIAAVESSHDQEVLAVLDVLKLGAETQFEAGSILAKNLARNFRLKYLPAIERGHTVVGLDHALEVLDSAASRGQSVRGAVLLDSGAEYLTVVLHASEQLALAVIRVLPKLDGDNRS